MKSRILRLALVTLMVLTVTVTLSLSPVEVSIKANNRFLSVTTNIAIGVGKLPDREYPRQQQAISVSTLGAAGLYATTSPWTALTGLSISANDYVFVCDAADSGSTAVNVKQNEINTAGTKYDGSEYYSAIPYGTILTAQTFIANATGTISVLKLELQTNGTPPVGDLTASLRATVGGVPSGSDLCSASLASTSIVNGWNTFTLGSPYSITNGVTYAIVLSYPNGDYDNGFVHVGLYSSDGYADGNAYEYVGGAWVDIWGWYDSSFDIGTVLITSAQNITLTADVTATNAGNVVVMIWSGKVTVTGTAYYIVVTNTSSAKAITAYKASGLADPAIDKYTSNTGTGTTPSSGATDTLSQADELIIGAIGMEEEDDEAGTWTTGAGYVSGNEQIACGNGGGAKSATIMSAAEVVSATTAQTAAQTGTGGNDWAAAIATYKMAASYDISNTPSSKAFGLVDANTTYYAKGSAPSNPVQDSECTFTITNNGATAIDLDMKISDFTGGVGWNIVSGSPGSNEVRITVYYSGQNPANGLVLSNNDQEFYDGLASSGTKKWDFKMETGTFTDGVAKSATLTVTAVAED